MTTTIYKTPNCPRCRELAAYLTQLGVDFDSGYRLNWLAGCTADTEVGKVHSDPLPKRPATYPAASLLPFQRILVL